MYDNSMVKSIGTFDLEVCPDIVVIEEERTFCCFSNSQVTLTSHRMSGESFSSTFENPEMRLQIRAWNAMK